MSKINLLVGFVIVSVLGFVFHFAFDFFNNPWLKIVFAQNESIFEHLKLFIFPTIIYMLFDLAFSKDKDFIFASYTSGIIVSSIFMISGFYTYSGIIGKDILAVDIGLFFLCVILIFYYRYKKITLFDGANSVIAFFVFIAIIELFTFYPANINLFKDPTLKAGLEYLVNLFR